MPDLAAERRERLAALAARLALTGAGPQPVWAPLARLTAAQLLRPGTPATTDLAAELAAVCAAAGAAVRRRPGWLRAELPPGPLPVKARADLAAAAVLCVLAAALRGGTPAAVRCLGAGPALILTVSGGVRSDTGPAPPLLQHLAAEAGGSVVFAAGERFTAALRLPLTGGICRPARRAEDLLADRYSLLYQFLGPFCAGPWC